MGTRAAKEGRTHMPYALHEMQSPPSCFAAECDAPYFDSADTVLSRARAQGRRRARRTVPEPRWETRRPGHFLF